MQAWYLHAPEGDVGVAERGADDLDADLVRPRRRHLHLLHLQRLPGRLAHSRCATIARRSESRRDYSKCLSRLGAEMQLRVQIKQFRTYLCI